MSEDEEHGTGVIAFTSRRDGVERRVRIDWDLVSTAEYRAMARNKQALTALGTDGFRLFHGEQEEAFDSLEEMLDTTMDPERRRLLKVTIEDAVGADAIFTILMGDKVEPRREFIEMNALNVKNLDV